MAIGLDTAAGAALGGAASGFIEGQQAATKEQLAALAIAEGKQGMELKQIEIDRTKGLLAAQKNIMSKMAASNEKLATDPQGLATQLALRSIQAGSALQDSGFWEEGQAQISRGVQLMTNAASLQSTLSDQQTHDAALMSSVADDVLKRTAADPAHADEIQNKTMLALRTLYPGHQFQIQPGQAFNRDTWETIRSTAYSQLDKAKMAKEQAETIKDAAQTKEAEAATEQKRALADQERARAEALRRAGVTQDKKTQAQKKLQQDAINDIDNLLEQLSVEDPNALTGLHGRVTRAKEFVEAEGFGLSEDEMPQHKLQAGVDVLLAKLPRVLTGSAYRNKDMQEIIHDLADLKSFGTSGAGARTQLSALRDSIQAQMDESPVEDTNLLREGREFGSEAEIEAAAKKGEIKDGDIVTVDGQEYVWKAK